MDEVERFLSLLWGEKDAERGLIEIFSGVLEAGKLKDVHGRHFKAADGAAEEVRRLMAAAPPREVYVCVSLGRERPESGRLREADVCGCCGLWCDLDFAGAEHTTRRYPPDEAAARKILEACGLKPTLLVHSGHGLQVWWLFAETLYFDKVEEKIRFRALAHDWIGTIQAHAAAAGGWEVDPAKDLVRVLRVAGTTNHKGEIPAAVRVLEVDGPRYASLNDFEQLVCPEVRKPSIVSNAEIATLVKEIEGVIASGQNHGFPVDKLEALRTNETKFEETWKRRRREFGTDASRYDASLAWYAVRIHCPVKEVIQLITDHRTVHKDDPKMKCLRPDYLARTILWAQRSVTEEVFLERLDQHENEVLSHEGHQSMLEQLRQWLKVGDLAGVKKYGRSDSRYFLILKDGHSFEVGTAETMLSAKRFATSVYDNCRVVVPGMKDWEWRRVAGLLQLIAEEDLMDGEGKQAQLEEWVEEYLGSNVIRDEATYNESLEMREPFVKDGWVYLMAAPLRRYIIMACMERITNKELKVMLKESGFKGGRVTARVKSTGGKVVCRYYYSRKIMMHQPPRTEEMKFSDTPLPPV